MMHRLCRNTCYASDGCILATIQFADSSSQSNSNIVTPHAGSTKPQRVCPRWRCPCIAGRRPRRSHARTVPHLAQMLYNTSKAVQHALLHSFASHHHRHYLGWRSQCRHVSCAFQVSKCKFQMTSYIGGTNISISSTPMLLRYIYSDLVQTSVVLDFLTKESAIQHIRPTSRRDVIVRELIHWRNLVYTLMCRLHTTTDKRCIHAMLPKVTHQHLSFVGCDLRTIRISKARDIDYLLVANISRVLEGVHEGIVELDSRRNQGSLNCSLDTESETSGMKKFSAQFANF